MYAASGFRNPALKLLRLLHPLQQVRHSVEPKMASFALGFFAASTFFFLELSHDWKARGNLKRKEKSPVLRSVEQPFRAYSALQTF